MINQMFFPAIVENRNDPLQLGRVQVRVFGIHSENLSDIPTVDLPWAITLMPATSASVSGIGNSGVGYIEGTQVFVFFQDGESHQQPVILGSVHGIPTAQDPLNSRQDTFEAIAAIAPTTQQVKVNQYASSTLLDGSGQPVVDGSGNPVQTGTPVAPDLDISRMVAQYGSNVTTVYNTLLNYGVKDNYAIVSVLSNIAKESKFKSVRESLDYTSVSRLKEIFTSKFKDMTDDEVTAYVSNQTKLANLVYANSDGNGNEASGDGYKYRGGGFVQLTKKNNYAKVGSAIGVDLVSNPDLILAPENAAKAAVQYFIQRFGSPSRLSFNSLEEALTEVTKKVNPRGFAHDYPIVLVNSKLCTINKDSSGEKKVDAAIQKQADPSNDVNSNLTKEEIDSGISIKSALAGASGFKDPNGKYPNTALLNEPDTARVARRNTTNTYVETRIKNKRGDMKTTDGLFSEPDTAYNATYPYNHAYTTESGHVLEFDDTPGSERINMFHKSGTFTEIDKFGNQVNKIVGDSYTITDRNGYIYIDGVARVTIASDVKLSIGGNCDISVDGNLTYNVGGNVTYKVGGSLLTGTLGDVSTQVGGNFHLDATSLYIASDTSTAVTPEARSGQSTDYAPQIPENFIGAASFDFDDAPPEVVAQQQQAAIASGAITQRQLDEGAAAKPDKVDDAEPPSNASPLPVSCALFANMSDIPDTLQLSKYFSLGMLSTKAVVSHYKVTAQHKLTVTEIVCNLKHLAENCLDPIRIKYPNMMVTSAFRVGSGTSQHERGMAADMQFNGASKSDYFDIATWIKANIAYDQLLLEFKTTGTGLPWIHISYNPNGLRKQVLTFMNNQSVGAGLQRLQT